MPFDTNVFEKHIIYIYLVKDSSFVGRYEGIQYASNQLSFASGTVSMIIDKFNKKNGNRRKTLSRRLNEYIFITTKPI